jgi:hypothetical protein
MATQGDPPTKIAELPLTAFGFQNGSSSRRCAPAGCSTPHSISSKAPTLRRCTVCNTDFVAKRVDAKFCSSACRQRSYRQRLVTA